MVAENIPLAQGGIIFAGLIYLLFALIAFLIGADKIKRVLPPVVTGPVIVVIGINLASTAIGDATGGLSLADGLTSEIALNLGIALFTLFVVILCSIFAHGFFKLVPILIGIAAGYVLCIILGAVGVFHMAYSAITSAAWINIPCDKGYEWSSLLCLFRNLSWAPFFHRTDRLCYLYGTHR